MKIRIHTAPEKCDVTGKRAFLLELELAEYFTPERAVDITDKLAYITTKGWWLHIVWENGATTTARSAR